MSAPPQLEIKFLDIFGDYYHMPSGSVSKVDDRKLGIPQYTEFNDKYGFKNPNFKTTRATGLIGGVATEEEAEFVKYFGVPYIYGPSLVSQKAVCRPANFAKMKQFLEYRLTTLDAQIKSPLAMSTGNSLPTVKFKKIKDKLSNFLTEMGSSKTLPTCDDYKIDYFQDDSDLMNYLTRALYYGLKPDAGTDEHVKCVNLFRDAAGTDAELKALLEIVKDKRKDGMLSFMELVGSTLAGLIQKINQDRSFATATTGTATATATAATAATAGAEAAEAKSYLDTVRKLHDQLIVFFDEISKSDSGEIGKKTFIKGQPIAEILTQFTAAVAASKRYLTSSGAGKPGTPAFPTKVEDLKKLIMDGLVGVGGTVDSAMKADSVYDKNMSKVLTDLLAFLEKGPITSAAVGAMIDKITLITAFKDVDVMEILKSYMGVYGLINKEIFGDNISSVITSYQKLFAILRALNLFNDLKSKQPTIEDNIKLKLNKKVKYNGNNYDIVNFNFYKSGDLTYGFYTLNNGGLQNTNVYFDTPLESSTEDSSIIQIKNPFDTTKNINSLYEITSNDTFDIGKTIEINTGNPEIIREQYVFLNSNTLTAAAVRKYNFIYNIVVKNPDTKYYLRKIEFTRNVADYHIKAGKPEDGEEKFDLGAPVASTGTGAGAGTVDPARLTAELAAAKAELARLQAELATKGGEATAATAALRITQAELATAVANLDTKTKELDALKVAGAGGGAAPDPAKDARIAALEREVGELRGVLLASAAAAASKISTSDAELVALEKSKKTLIGEVDALQDAISAATIIRGREKITERDNKNRDLIAKLNEIIEALQKRIQALEQINITLIGKKDQEILAVQKAAKDASDKAKTELDAAQIALAEAERLKAAAEGQVAAETAKCTALQTELDALRASGAGTADQIAELQKELAAARAAPAPAGATPDIAILEARIAELEGLLAVAQGSAKTFETARDDATARAEVAEAARAAAGRELAEAQAAVAAKEAEKVALERRLAEKEAELAAATDAGAAPDPRIRELTAEVEILRTQLEKIKADVTAAAEADKTAAVADVQAEFEAERAKAAAATASATSAEAAREAAQKQLESLREQLVEAQGRIRNLEEQLAAASKLTADEVTALHRELAAKKREATGLSIRLSAFTAGGGTADDRDAEIKRLQQVETDQAAEIENKKKEVSTASADLKAAQEAARKALREKTTAEAEAKRLATELAAAQAAGTTTEELQAGIRDLEARLATAKTALAEASAKMAPSEKELQQLLSRRNALQREAREAATSVATAQELIRGLAARNVELDKEAGHIGAILGARNRIQALLAEVELQKKELTGLKTKQSIGELGKSDATFWKASSQGYAEMVDKLEKQLKGVIDNLSYSESLLAQRNEELHQKDRRIRELEEKPVKAGTVNPMLGSVDNIPMFKLQLELNTLRREKEALEAEVDRLKAEKGASTGAVDNPTIAAMLDKIRVYILAKGLTEEKFSEMEGALERVQELEAQLRSKEHEIATKVEELEIARRELKTSKEDERAKQDEIREIESVVSKLVSDHESIIKSLEEELKKVDITHVPKEIADELYAKIRELQSQITESQRQEGVPEDESSITADVFLSKASAIYRRAKKQQDKIGRKVVGELSWGSQQKYEKALAGKDSEIAALTAAVSEATKNAEAAAKEALDELRAENQALQIENSSLKEQLAALQTQLASMRNVSKVQTFGSLSGMLSSPAFKAATIGIFTKFADKKERKTYTNLNVNTNIRSSLPGQPEGTETSAPLRAYYIQTLEALAKELGAIKKDGSEDPDITFVENQQEIQLLANILKIMSSPQPSGLYALIDDSLLLSNIKTLTDKLKTQREGFSSYEPSLFIPDENSLSILSDVDKLNFSAINKPKITSYFKSKNDNIFITYPSMKISGEQSEGVADLDRNSYISKVSLSLFNIGEFAVKQDKFINGKMLSDLKVEDKSFFTEPTNGKLISRSEIVRIFIKSLLSALKSAWGPMVNNK